jgi:hypothetical protein
MERISRRACAVCDLPGYDLQDAIFRMGSATVCRGSWIHEIRFRWNVTPLLPLHMLTRALVLSSRLDLPLVLLMAIVHEAGSPRMRPD